MSCCARFGDLLPTVAIENAKNDNLLFVSFGTREKIGLELCVARRRRPRAAVTSLIGCGESEGKKLASARSLARKDGGEEGFDEGGERRERREAPVGRTGTKGRRRRRASATARRGEGAMRARRRAVRRPIKTNGTATEPKTNVRGAALAERALFRPRARSGAAAARHALTISLALLGRVVAAPRTRVRARALGRRTPAVYDLRRRQV